jgi:hypothetical protein
VTPYSVNKVRAGVVNHPSLWPFGGYNEIQKPKVRYALINHDELKDLLNITEMDWTRNPDDAQKTFDLLGSEGKELFWIENTTRRLKDGYNYFGRHPAAYWQSGQRQRSECLAWLTSEALPACR